MLGGFTVKKTNKQNLEEKYVFNPSTHKGCKKATRGAKKKCEVQLHHRRGLMSEWHAMSGQCIVEWDIPGLNPEGNFPLFDPSLSESRHY